MKKLLSAFVFCVATWSAAAASPAASSFDLSAIQVGRVVSLVYSEALGVNFVLSPEVIADERLVSFRYKPAPGQTLRAFLSQFLDSLGYRVETRGAVDFVGIKLLSAEPVTLPVPLVTVVYRPVHREAAYLRRVVEPFLNAREPELLPFNTRGAGAPAGPAGASAAVGAGGPVVMPAITPGSFQPVTSAAAPGTSSEGVDVLIFRLPAAEAALVQSLLPQIDSDPGQLVIRAVVYEVATSKADGSALQLFASVLGGRLGLTLNAGAPALSNSLSLKVGGIEAVLSAMSLDNRFNAVTQPRLRVRSGETSRLVVGQDVPVVGAVTYQNGQPVRSVEYRSAGTILTVKPTVRGDLVHVDVQQQLSSFVRTDTGVNESPTLIKRDLQTSISAASGEVIVLGGLTESRNSRTKRGVSFFPWSTSDVADDGSTDVLVVLQVDRL